MNRRLQRYVCRAGLFALAALSVVFGQARSASVKEQVTIVTVAVYPDTISPQEETVVGRRFRIRLVNYVGVGSMTFSLKKDSGAQLRQIRLTNERAKKSDEMTLEPGTYILEIAGMTKWTCRLHVRPPSK